MGYNGCSPKCDEGYSGSGVVCTQNCPNDFKSYAYYCAKPEGYNRGEGSVMAFPESEMFGFMYYPKCKEGFKADGCCTCKPGCPDGMKDM